MSSFCSWGFFLSFTSLIVVKGFEDNSVIWGFNSSFSIIINTNDWIEKGANPTLNTATFEGEKLIVGLAYHYAWNEVVYSDNASHTLFVYQDRRAVYAYVGTSFDVGQVTVDWISNTLYWADAGFGWIGLQPLVKNIARYGANVNLRVVVSQSLNKPYGITVDSLNRLLFWSDFGWPPKIESSDLLGADRKVLVWQGLFKPTTLSLDPQENRLYWIDQMKESIESCDMNGMNRRIAVFTEGHSLIGLHLYQNYIFVTDSTDNSVRVISKTTGQDIIPSIPSGAIPGDITVFSNASQPRETVPCDVASCSQICVNRGNNSYSCACSSGYTLTDGKTCASATSIWKSFLATDGQTVCAVPVYLLYSFNYVPPSRYIRCFLNASDIRFLAVNNQNKTLYYVTHTSLRSYDITTGNSTELYTGQEVITGLEFDWVSGSLIFSQRTINRIAVLAKGQLSPQVLYANRPAVTDIAVDSRQGRLFWFEKNTIDVLMSGSVNGSVNPTLILNTTSAVTYLTSPESLQYDHLTDRLFWISSGQYLVSVTSSGANRKVLPLNALSQYSRLAIFRSLVVWMSSSPTRNLTFRNSDLGTADNLLTFNIPNLNNLTDLIFYDASEEATIDNACESDNGGCSQLCHVSGNGHQCACNFGFQLQADGKTCAATYMDSNFYLVGDQLSSRMYQISATGVSTLNFDLGSPTTAMTYNPTTREVIWFDGKPGVIKISSLDGRSQRIVNVGTIREGTSVANDIVSCTSLALDYSTNNLYAALRLKDTYGAIQLISVDKGVSWTLMKFSTDPARFLDIYPAKGLLVYATDSGNILYGDMAMTKLAPLQKGQKGLSGLTFTDSGASVAWSIQDADKIMNMDLASLTLVPYVSRSGTFPYALTSSGTDLYFFSTATRTIQKLDLGYKEEAVFPLVPEMGTLQTLYVQGPILTQEPTSCSLKNGRCSTLCIPTSNSARKCQCANDVILKGDERTCSDVEECSSFFTHGNFDYLCDGYPSESCSYTCSDGYAKNTSSPQVLLCDSSSQWNFPLNYACYKVPPGSTPDLPGYGIAIIVVGVVIIAAIVIGVVIWKRMKSNRKKSAALFSSLNAPAPIIIVTQKGMHCQAPPSDYTDPYSKPEEVYDELESVHGQDSLRYKSFSDLTPTNCRKSKAGLDNNGADVDRHSYVEPLADPSPVNYRASNVYGPNPRQLQGPPSCGNADQKYLTPASF